MRPMPELMIEELPVPPIGSMNRREMVHYVHEEAVSHGWTR